MKRAILAAAFALCALGAGSACVDLFHSTDYETLCALDAAAPGCANREGGQADSGPDAADAAPLDFCSLGPTAARAMAEHACAWLGACSSPFDQNAFGQCMIHATLAFDCSANPNEPIRPGSLHDLWQALGGARSCSELNQALNPSGALCSGTGYACVGKESPTLLECVDGGESAESCEMEGRVCAGAGVCAPKGALASCKTSHCGSDSVLHDCESSSDVGYDCSPFGSGKCVESSGGPSCKPAPSSPCSGGFDVSCKGDVAESCPAGERVSVDCARLSADAKCVPGKPTPIWNVVGQCQGKSACSPGCSGDTVKGCAQGMAFQTSCKQQGLGTCHEVSLVGGAKGYACKAP